MFVFVCDRVSVCVEWKMYPRFDQNLNWIGPIPICFTAYINSGEIKRPQDSDQMFLSEALYLVQLF